MTKTTRVQKHKESRPLTVDIIALLFSGKYASQREMRRLMSGVSHRELVVTKQVARAVSKLSKQGWIERKKVHDKIYFRITREGRIRHLIFNLKTYSRIRGKRATIVVFDIPEEKRTFRNFIRRLLKQMGFTILQKSVLVTPNILPEDFFELLRETKLLQHFLFIEGRIHFKK